MHGRFPARPVRAPGLPRDPVALRKPRRQCPWGARSDRSWSSGSLASPLSHAPGRRTLRHVKTSHRDGGRVQPAAAGETRTSAPPQPPPSPGDAGRTKDCRERRAGEGTARDDGREKETSRSGGRQTKTRSERPPPLPFSRLRREKVADGRMRAAARSEAGAPGERRASSPTTHARRRPQPARTVAPPAAAVAHPAAADRAAPPGYAGQPSSALRAPSPSTPGEGRPRRRRLGVRTGFRRPCRGRRRRSRAGRPARRGHRRRRRGPSARRGRSRPRAPGRRRLRRGRRASSASR